MSGSREALPYHEESKINRPPAIPNLVHLLPKAELLNGEIFYSLNEARIVIESWRRHYNTLRPHRSLGYKPPAPEVFVPAFAAWPAALRRPASPATLAQPPTLN